MPVRHVLLGALAALCCGTALAWSADSAADDQPWLREYCGQCIHDRQDCLHGTAEDRDDEDESCVESYSWCLYRLGLDEADCAPYVDRAAGFPALNDVSSAGRPARGGRAASVTIIEFSEYDTALAGSCEASVEKVMQTYGDKVRHVFRNFPIHSADGRRAALAAACANEQDKFWEYHARLFNAPDLTEAGLNELAGATGLNVARFARCLAQRKFERDVATDIADAKKASVDGIPTFFINGNRIDGCPTNTEWFTLIIDKELARSGQRTPAPRK